MTLKTFPALNTSPATPEQALFIHPEADPIDVHSDMLNAIATRSHALVETLSLCLDKTTGATVRLSDATISHLLWQLSGNLELILQIAHTAPDRIRCASNNGVKPEALEPVPEVDEHALRTKAVGQWRQILTGYGLTLPQNKDTLAPCPACGGLFRFEDIEGTGSWCCEQCGTGDGLSLLLKVSRWSKPETMALLSDWLASATSEPRPSADGSAVSKTAGYRPGVAPGAREGVHDSL